MANPSRRLCLRTMAALSSVFASLPGAAQQGASVRPIRIIVAGAAGGGIDLVARLVCARLAMVLQQTVFVENKGGANGMSATDAVARASPDGSTLLFSYTAAMLINPMLRAKASIDSLSSLEPIAQIGAAGNLLIVSPSLPVHSATELATFVRAHPDSLSYGTWGVGSGGHLAMEQFLQASDLRLTHVPYQGTGLVASAILGDSIKIGWIDVTSQLRQIKAGRLRAIAVTGTQRLPQLPEVPTMAEQGYPLTVVAWYGLFAPAKTPSSVVLRLNAAVNEMLSDPEFRSQLKALNLPEPPIRTPEQFRQVIVDDTRTWAEILKTVRVALD